MRSVSTISLLAIGGFVFLLAGCKDKQTVEYEQKQVCAQHLKAINEAKRQYAFEHNLGADDEVAWGDIIGEDKHLREFPECPAGGAYALNTVGERPSCTFKGEFYTHSYPEE